MIKWRKVSQYLYKSEDGTWKIFGQVTKNNPTRTPKAIYFVKKNGVLTSFEGGSLAQAKYYCQMSTT